MTVLAQYLIDNNPQPSGARPPDDGRWVVILLVGACLIGLVVSLTGAQG